MYSLVSNVSIQFDKDNQYFFKQVSTGARCEWCGELKQAITQAIVNNLVAQISRVGNDSFEWLKQKNQIILFIDWFSIN